VSRAGQGGEREEGEMVGGAELLGNRQRARVGGLMGVDSRWGWGMGERRWKSNHGEGRADSYFR